MNVPNSWGLYGDKKKAYWMSWKRFCDNKLYEDLGFRDLNLFNQAMLAKLSWRIVRNPNCRLAQVLKKVGTLRMGIFIMQPWGITFLLYGKG